MEIMKELKYRKEPPEGGWGILICIGMALPFISALGSMPSFGLVFGDFLTDLGEGTSAIALITSCFFSAMSFSGLFTNTLFKKYSIRTVGLAGGIIYFIGSFIQIFVQSTVQLLIAFSILQGAAFGLMVPSAYTTFNNYFVERRVMMMSFAQSLIGVGTMFYPVVMQKLLVTFGFRGCLAVLAGINAHAIFGMLVMHPVEWHMKKVPILQEEMKEVVANNHQTADKDDDDKEETVQAEPLVKSARKVSIDQTHVTQNSIEKLMKRRKSSGSGFNSRRASSIASLGNWTGAVIVSDNSERDPKPSGKWQVLVDFLDLTLFKDLVYVNIVLGISFALYSDVAFFTIQPMYMFEIGFEKADTATIIAIGAGADLGSRVFLALSSAFVTVPSRYIYLAGAFFTVIARFAFLSVFDYLGMAIITAIMGFLRTWVHVPLPLVFAEHLPKERFPSGYGLFMFLQGNIMFAIGPIVGYIRDATKSYVITFHCLNFFMAACAVPWIVEILYVKIRGKPKKTPEAIAQPDTEAAN